MVSRIHISRATLDCLEGSYETEDGHGYERNEFLRKHNIDTFFICPKEEDTTMEVEPSKLRMTIRTSNTDNLFGSINNMSYVSCLSLGYHRSNLISHHDFNDVSDNDQWVSDGSNDEL